MPSWFGSAALILSAACTLALAWSARRLSGLEDRIAGVEERLAGTGQAKGSPDTAGSTESQALAKDLARLKVVAAQLEDMSKNLAAGEPGAGSLTLADLRTAVEEVLKRREAEARALRAAADGVKARQHYEKVLPGLKQRLGLTEAQELDVRKLLEEQVEAYTREWSKANGPSPEEMQAINRDTESRIREKLTAEQRTKFDAVPKPWFVPSPGLLGGGR